MDSQKENQQSSHKKYIFNPNQNAKNNQSSSNSKSNINNIEMKDIPSNSTNPSTNPNMINNNNSIKDNINKNNNNSSSSKKSKRSQEEEKKNIEDDQSQKIQQNSNEQNSPSNNENNYNNNESQIKNRIKIEKSNHIINITNYLNNMLNKINAQWENDRNNYGQFFEKEIIPQLSNLLNQPCITTQKEIILLFFVFLCQYFNQRKNFLDQIPLNEANLLFAVINGNFNIFSKFPKINNTNSQNEQNYDLIGDNEFYYKYKEMLPDEEVENGEIILQNNCMYKYFLEFLFHSGFADCYLDKLLTRNDLDPCFYMTISIYPVSLLNYVSNDFLNKTNFNIRIIFNFLNQMTNILQNMQNYIKNNKQGFYDFMDSLMKSIIDRILGVFNRKIDFLFSQYRTQCEQFSLIAFQFCEALLKQQKLELRIFGLSKISLIAEFYTKRNGNEFKQFYDVNKILQYFQNLFISFLLKINIFDLIFGENIHEALVERSYNILSFLYRNNCFPPEQIATLWKLSQSKYQSINNSIISLFGKILPEFSNNDCDSILKIISNIKFNEVNETTLKLLENFSISNERHEHLLFILYNYSNELNFYKGLSQAIITKSRSILINLLFNKKYVKDLLQCIKNCLFCIDNNYLINTNRNILKDILNEFAKYANNNNHNINELYPLINEKVYNFGTLMTFLDDNFSLYNILLTNLLFLKSLFRFLSSEAIKYKQIINNGNYDFNIYINAENLYEKFKNETRADFYNSNNNENDNDMDLDDDTETINTNFQVNISSNDNNNINNNNNNNNNNINNSEIGSLFLLPTNKNDIDNYMKLFLNDFICYFKNNLLQKNIALTDDEIINNIFNNFEFSFEKNTFVNSFKTIIDIIFTSHSTGNIYFKREYFDKLYTILIENALAESEKNLFYSLVNKCFYMQVKNPNLITDKDKEYLFIKKIGSKNINNLPYCAFDCFKLLMIEINEKNNNAKYCKSTQKFTSIQKLELFFGFKILISFYLDNKNSRIVNNALEVLTNILSISACDMINRKFFLDKIFDDFHEKLINNANFKEENIKNQFMKLMKLIRVVNKTKVNKNLYDPNDNRNQIKITINNVYFFKDSPSLDTIYFFKGAQIKKLKEYLIQNILCTQNNLELFKLLSTDSAKQATINTLDDFQVEILTNSPIILEYQNHTLRDEYTLADYNIPNDAQILLLNGAGKMEVDEDYKMTDEQLKEGYEQIKVVFGDKFNEEIMKASLIKHKGDIQNAIIFLTVPDNVNALTKEIGEKMEINIKKNEEIICFDENQFNLLLEILNKCNDSDIDNSIWELFSEIKYNENIINNYVENDFEKLLSSLDINKMILSLKFINSLVFDDNSFCIFNKLTKDKKDIWVSKFINNESIISLILSTLSKKIEESNFIIHEKIISIFIDWFNKIFHKILDLISQTNNNNNNNTNANNNNVININSVDNNDNGNSSSPLTNANNLNSNNNINTIDLYGSFEIKMEEAVKFRKILDNLDFAVYLYKILNIIFSAPHPQNKKQIISNIFQIFQKYFQISPLKVKSLLNEEEKNKYLLFLIIYENESDIRKETVKFINILMQNIKTLSSGDNSISNEINIQSSLLSFYFDTVNSDNTFYEQFYELYGNLLKFDQIKQGIISIDKLTDLIRKLFNSLYEFYSNINKVQIFPISPAVVKKQTFNIYILCCFHQFYDYYLRLEVENQLSKNRNIVFLLYNCLFQIINIDREKNSFCGYLFNDNTLRENAFNLLSIIISLDKKYFHFILQKIVNHHTALEEKITDLPIDDNIRDINNQKLIGLKNFGATCYLNSLFQQMFMIPTFYNDIFSFNINDKRENLTHSVLYNMQLTFANLKKSCMSYYPPYYFIKSFKKAFNGEPISFSIQQDSDEFLAILCDELEKEAKNFGKENFLENSFKGKITNEIVSLEKEFPYYSQSDEPFIRITLDIKGHQKLEDALDAYVKGEILDGENKYYVEKYKKKISIKKRTSLKKISNQIIIHLKRFEFDFVTFTNNKLNDYLKFPLEINFKKWTRAFLRINDLNINNNNNNIINNSGSNYNSQINIDEEEKDNLNNEKMNYVLTGILVHSGSSLKCGHYYSFIEDQETNLWHQFNDSSITDYNINTDLEKECFGNINNQTNQYGKGAYLLFYTKKECIKSFKNLKQIKISDNILKEVQKENIHFLNIKNFNSKIYQNFIIKFIQVAFDYFGNNNRNNEIDSDESSQNSNFNIINDSSILMNDELIEEEKTYDKILFMLKGNKENNINIADSEINIIPENIEQIYEKCRSEIKYTNINKNNNDNDNEGPNDSKRITKKDIMELLYNYTFGIIFQYNFGRDAKLSECLKIFSFLLSSNIKYALMIVKKVEKNMNIFIDLLFKYVFFDKDMTSINKDIHIFFISLFDSIYKYEKGKFGIITNETFFYFEKNDKGKLLVVKEYKSCFLRLIRKIFCENLEKCRKEYLKDVLFLEVFLSLVTNYPEASLVCSDYLLSLISFISNNSINGFQSKKNPNFKMGNDQQFQPNHNYIKIFCNIILRSVTRGMLSSKALSPFFIFDKNQGRGVNFDLCPKIPPNFEQCINDSFFSGYILYLDYSMPREVVCHLSFFDQNISVLIMNLINALMKKNFFFILYGEKIFNSACNAFDLRDGLENLRLNTLFELEDDDNNVNGINNSGNMKLFEYYTSQKMKFPSFVATSIYIIAKAMEKYQVMLEYFVKNKKKVKWISDFNREILYENGEIKNNFTKANTLSQHPDLFPVLQNSFINKIGI